MTFGYLKLKWRKKVDNMCWCVKKFVDSRRRKSCIAGGNDMPKSNQMLILYHCCCLQELVTLQKDMSYARGLFDDADLVKSRHIGTWGKMGLISVFVWGFTTLTFSRIFGEMNFIQSAYGRSKIRCDHSHGLLMPSAHVIA